MVPQILVRLGSPLAFPQVLVELRARAYGSNIHGRIVDRWSGVTVRYNGVFASSLTTGTTLAQSADTKSYSLP